MNKHMLVVTDAQLEFLRSAVEELDRNFQEDRQTFRDYSEADIVEHNSTLQDAYHALQSATDLAPVKFPQYNGEWGFVSEGHKTVKSVMFIEGVTGEATGFVLADLAGEFEGAPITTMKGTWRKVFIP